MEGLNLGREFFRYGSYWLVQSVTVDENERFSWLVVMGRWSGRGPRPLWADEEHRFLMFRRRKETGEYV